VLNFDFELSFYFVNPFKLGKRVFGFIKTLLRYEVTNKVYQGGIESFTKVKWFQ